MVLYHMFEAFCETKLENVTGQDVGFGLVRQHIVPSIISKYSR